MKTVLITTTATEAAASVQEAVFQATDGRPGPALLNLPSDMGLVECGDPLIVKSAPGLSSPDNTQLAAAREFIFHAWQTCIWRDDSYSMR